MAGLRLAAGREGQGGHAARPAGRRARASCARSSPMPDGIADVTWSPDGKWLAFTSRTRDARYEAKDESWQSPRKVETFFARLDSVGWTFDRPLHVHVVAADGTGSVRNLTPGPFQHHGLSWLADSSGVVTAAARHDGWDRDLAEDLYVVPLDGPVRALTKQTGMYSQPAVSPDGASVAFLGADDPGIDPQNAKVGVIDLAGGGHRWVSTGLDRTFMPTAGVRPPVWLDDVDAAGDRRGPRRHAPVPARRRRVDAARARHVRAPLGVVVRRRRRPHRHGPVDRRAPVRDRHPGRPGHGADPQLPRLGEVRRADDRRDRRDRCVDHAPRGVRGAAEVPRAAQRPRRAVHPVRRDVLRRGPDAGRRRVRRRHVQPPRRQRAGHAVGPGDHGSQAPQGPRHRAGARSTSTT